jgi:hypothetical protein
MSNYKDLKQINFANVVDSGTEGTRVASGTTGQRGSTAGQIRYNTTTNLLEYYNNSSFKAVDTPPTVSSIDVTEVDSQAGGNQTIVITGSNFASGAIATFVGAAGTDFNASTTTVDSTTQITAVAPKSSFLNAQEPYGVKVLNTSGLANTLDSQINVDSAPIWNTASGSLGSIYDSMRSSASVSATATDPDGDTVAYSLQSGSLPSGLSLNTSTGAISGTASAVGSNTTSSFTLRATANSKTADRAFSIVVYAPVTETITSSQTWNVPTGLTSASIQLAAGGGGGGGGGSGGGCGYASGGGGGQGANGASNSYRGGNGSGGGNYNAGAGGHGGGSNFNSAFTVDLSGTTSVSVTVGAGGAGGAGGLYRGGSSGGSFGGRSGSSGSTGSQSSFGSFGSTSGSNGTINQSGNANNGLDDTENTAGYGRPQSDGRVGGVGGAGKVVITY